MIQAGVSDFVPGEDIGPYAVRLAMVIVGMLWLAVSLYNRALQELA